jgi:chromate transporter
MSLAMSLRSSGASSAVVDLALYSTEADPLLGVVGEETYGDNVQLPSNLRPSISESRRFEPLSERIKDVVKVYWHLGLISFGGPSAHVAILRDHLVFVNNWMDEDIFMELFALGEFVATPLHCERAWTHQAVVSCTHPSFSLLLPWWTGQALPGASSTHLVISSAATHGGALGGMLAFVMWCLPGFLILAMSGMFLYDFVDPSSPPVWLLGVPPAAMSLIFKASFGFALTLDRLGCAIATVSCATSIMINGDMRIPSNSSQIVYPALLVMSAIVTFLDFSSHSPIGTYIKPLASQQEPTAQDRKLSNKIGISVWQGVLCFLMWLGILVGTITAVNMGLGNDNLVLFESFYRIGTLIFGGGIVMIPMAHTEFVENKGWLTEEQFFQGLGLAQSLPGPMFNFAAFLGATHSGLVGAVLGAVGLFGPGTILIFAMLPAWSRTRHLAWFKAVLKGFNASSIGLIVGGCVFLYAKSVKTAADAMVFVLAGGLASFYNVQAPGVILAGVILGAIFSPALLNVGQKAYH